MIIMSIRNQNILVAVAVALLVVVSVSAFLALKKLDRIAATIERAEQDKLERVVSIAERQERRAMAVLQAGAPLGAAVVKKGTEVVSTVDGEHLAESATSGLKDLGGATQDGVKEIGSALKRKVLKMIEEGSAKKTSGGNADNKKEEIPDD